MQYSALQARRTLGGLVVMFGAVLAIQGVPSLRGIAGWLPGTPTMGPQPPLLFIAAGLCVLLLPERAQLQRGLAWLASACVGVLLLLPLQSLGEHLLFLLGGSAASAAVPAGRMAPNTALAFLAAGLACLIALRYRPRWFAWPLTLCVSAVTLLGGAGLLGHLLQLEALYRIASFNRMVAPTAAGLTLLSLALWLLQAQLAAASPRPPRRHLTRITYRAVIVLSLMVLAAGVAALVALRDTFDRSTQQMLGLTAKTNATAMGQALGAALWLPQAMATRQPVQAALAALRGMSAADPAARRALDQVARNALSAGIDGVVLFDAQGRQVAAAGLAVTTEGLVTQTLQGPAGMPGPPPRLLWRDGHLLLAGSNVLADGQHVGRVQVLQRLPGLDRLLQTLRQSGEGTDAVICTREAADLAVCAPSAFYPQHLRIPMFDERGQPKLPVNRALLGETGVTTATDLRGVDVLVAYAPVGPYGLGLVVKTDSHAAYAPLKQRINLLVLVFFALVALGTYALRRSVKPLVAQIVDEQRRTRLITDNLPVMISYIDRDERLTFLNDTFTEWTGINRHQALGRPLQQVISAAAYAQRKPALDRALAGERVVFEAVSTTRGVPRDLHNEYIPDRHSSGEVLGVYALSSDVSALKQVQRELTQLARSDTLTGLPNRLLFNERLAEALARSARSGLALALMFLDVDHFKAINDAHGHAGGDAVLQEFAQRLLLAVRSTDLVARLAGDEFVVILEGLHEAAEVETVAHKILARIADGAFGLGGLAPAPVGSVTTSIGAAFHRHGTASAPALLECADAALYQAKARGRNTFVLACLPASASLAPPVPLAPLAASTPPPAVDAAI